MKSIGFTFDEKILKSKTLSNFFEQLPKVFEHIEFASDDEILNKSLYKEAAQKTDQSHFHIPYFLGHKQFDFAYRQYNDYHDFFKLYEYLRPYSQNKPFIVIHGSSENNPQTANESNKRGLDYLLNFMVKKNMDGILCLENLTSNKASSNHIDKVFNLVQTFNHPQLKICYDLAHDYYNHPNYRFPSKDILDAIVYYHVHGMHTQKHQDLTYLPRHILQAIKGDNVINIEILLEACENDYTQTLINNLSFLSEM